MKSISFSLVFFLGMYTFADLSAQSFALDTNWGIHLFEYGYNGNPGGMLIQDDGKAMIWGSISSPQFPAMTCGRFFLESGEFDHTFPYRAATIMDVTRIEDGYINNTTTLLTKIDFFGNGDSLFNANYQASVNNWQKGGGLRTFVYPDGRMLVGCGYPCIGLWYKPDEHQAPYRILPNGRIDSTFNKTALGTVRGVIPYNDSLVLIYGPFVAYDSVPMKGLARIDFDGNLDTSFHNFFHFQSIVSIDRKHVDQYGRIMVKGRLLFEGDDTEYALVRLLSDGSIDETFNKINRMPPGAEYPQIINAICPTTDGGYLIGGMFTEIHGVPRGHIAKIDSSGNIDEEYFGGEGFKQIPTPADQSSFVNIYRILYHEIHDHYYFVGNFNHLDGNPVGRLVRFKGLLTNTSNPATESYPFTISPNPAAESIHIQLPENITGQQNLQVEIFNQLGQRVLYQTLSSPTVEVGHLPAGMYFVHLKAEDVHFKVQKLIVLK